MVGEGLAPPEKSEKRTLVGEGLAPPEKRNLDNKKTGAPRRSPTEKICFLIYNSVGRWLAAADFLERVVIALIGSSCAPTPTNAFKGQFL